MADWTMSLREILEPSKPAGSPWTDPNTILALAGEIFPAGSLDPLPAELRPRFSTGFIWHFFNDEIGMETLPLWQIALTGRIYNNAAYIQHLMELADQEVFTHLHRRRGEGTTTHGDSTTSTSSTQDTRDSTTTSKSKGSGDGTSAGNQDQNTKQEALTESTGNTRTNTQNTEGSAGETTQLYSDTPQNGLDPVRSGQYLTNATVNGNNDNRSGSTQGTNDQTNNGSTTTINTGGTSTIGETHQKTTSDTDSTTGTTGTARTDATGTNEGYTQRNDSDHDIDIEYDRLFESRPIMDRVWHLFDDLFMMIL